MNPMKTGRIICGYAMIAGLVWAGLPRAAAANLVDDLLADYSRVKSLSCEIQRDSEAEGQKSRTLSRMYYRAPNQINVQNLSPLKRTVVVDGSNLFSCIEGETKGFSRPLPLLDKAMLEQVRKVPGTPMEHLYALQGALETTLPPTSHYPDRRGYVLPRTYVVLSLDRQKRPALLEFFDGKDRKRRFGRFEYSNFVSLGPGVWISQRQEVEATLHGVIVKEITRLSDVKLNEPLSGELFDARRVFPGVSFVSSLSEVYPDQ